MDNSKGVLLFAHNNSEIDYGMMAYICAKYIEKNLNVPVSLATDTGTVRWLDQQDPKFKDQFDQIILTDHIPSPVTQEKKYYDGSLEYKKLNFGNGYRFNCYEFSPYEKTLVLDTDVLITNDRLKHIWDSKTDFMINSDHFDLARDRDVFEFQRVQDHGIDFYWATMFYFEKTAWCKVFFDLCNHIIENYEFYRFVYQIPGQLMRNDYVVSIAIHIINGFDNKVKPESLPCQIYYTVDRDELIKVDSDKEFLFLIQKKEYVGQYTLSRTSNQILHIMNKYSIIRNADRLLEVLNVG